MSPVKNKPRDGASAQEVTPEDVYLRRREFMRDFALGTATAAAIGGGLTTLVGGREPRVLEPPANSTPRDQAIARETAPSLYRVNEPQTPYDDVTSYNNYCEFGTAKSDPAELAQNFRARPWTVRVEGEVETPQTLDIDTLLRWFPHEERVYRMRCVEAWSMVIPWLGFPLAPLIARLNPTSRAKYVAFTTLEDSERMPGQRSWVLDWPYVEGLRIDEATHPLAFLAVGLYGRTLPNQNGAPIRLVVPWKYGFKGIKAIVKIELTERQPKTTWNDAAPGEYGFYANVNPNVDHPRWSQATERRIGEFFRRPTLPFNGYAESVAHLYRGMDLTRFF